MKVFKYEIREVGRAFDLSMPPGARIVHVGWQTIPSGTAEIDRRRSLWAVIEREEFARETRRFILAATGQEVGQSAKHIQTTIDADHFHVWHLFELPSVTPR